MTRFRRALAGIAVAAVFVTGTAACGQRQQNEDLDALREAIGKTERASYEFVYFEEADDTELEVRGLVEDDFRYKARLAIGGTPAYDEIVSDDALAARVLDARAFALLARPEGEPVAKPAADEPQPEIPTEDALATKRWVLDDDGAPPVLAVANDQRKPGQDPIYDALSTLRHVLAVTREMRVDKFNKDALDYRPKEDPFEDPEKLFPGEGVVRYDFEQTRLPRASDNDGANQAIPHVSNFRKMAVYVNRDGLIVRVDETIDVIGKLKDLRRNYDLELPNDEERAAKVAMEAINAVRRGQGEEPIRVRTMTLELFELGKPHRADLPTEAVVPGDLSLLVNRGRIDVSATPA